MEKTKENSSTNDEIKFPKDKKEATNLFIQLFKFDKSFFLSFLFYIHIIIQIVVLIFYIYGLSRGGFATFLLWILLYPLVFFIVRFIFEWISIVFSINNNLKEIKDELKSRK